MVKFIKNNSKKFYIIGSVILLLMIAAVGVLIGGEFTNKTHAAAETVRLEVRRNSLLTIYVSGKGVTPDPKSSTDNLDVYVVEKNTEVSLRAVNETNIFNGWEIFNLNDLETPIYQTYAENDDEEVVKTKIKADIRYDFTPTADVRIHAKARTPLQADFGTYRTSYFNISTEEDLYKLQLIFDAGNVVNNINNSNVLDAYDTYFKNYSTYEKGILGISDSASKAQAIYDGKLFDKIQNGFFYVTSSFSLFDERFTGIGSLTTPFNGVICGNVKNVKSTIFTTISGKESSGDIYRGIFKATGQEAVIRNLNIRTSIGIEKNTASQASNIYAGGIAGFVNESVLSNVDVLARIAIDSASANLHAGAIAGNFKGGLDKGRKVLLNGSNSTFILSTGSAGKNIYAGLVTGNAEDVYVKEANLDTTNFAISAKNTASNTYSDNTNVYLGNLFGKYTATETMPIEEVKISGTSKETITSLISSGNSYIGGLIGYLDVSSYSVDLGDVSITNTSGESKLSGTSVDRYSQANLLTAGLIACVNGSNLNAKPEFLDGIVEKTIDGVKRYEYNYIFNTDLLIQSVNNGIDDNGTSYGKTMATGFIARGYMNLNGENDSEGNEVYRNNILLSSGDYKTKVYATQSSTSKHANATADGKFNGTPDQEHCLATAFYGNLNATGITIQNMNIYASNYDIAATRELGSFGLGDVYAAGFIAYSKGVNFSNITIYLNDSYIKSHSLSYEVQNDISKNSTTNAAYSSNNNHAGGFIGFMQGSSTSSLSTISNVKISGNYYHNTDSEVGTTTVIEGIQNTKGTTTNFTNENYVGGVIGKIYHTNVNGLYYNGSTSNKDIISSLTHEDPPSAFCGGVIGYIRNGQDGSGTDYSATITLNNLEIKNANVYASATNSDLVDYNGGNTNVPDIYIGGIVGACYQTRNSLTINNAHTINSSIIGEGNEMSQIFSGGIIGTITWGGTLSVNNCYVYKSMIESSLIVNNDIENARADHISFAGGIQGQQGTRSNISYCAVIDTTLKSNFTSYSSNINDTDIRVAGIIANDSGSAGGWFQQAHTDVVGCYSNALLLSTVNNNGTVSSGIKHGISDKYANDSYYHQQNAGVSDTPGTALDFSKKQLTRNTATTIPASIANSGKKLYIHLSDTTNFSANNGSGNNVQVTGKTNNTLSYADVWINALSGGSNVQPNLNASEAELIKAGWFKLGQMIVYVGDPTGGDLQNDEYSFYDDILNKEYIPVIENDSFKYEDEKLVVQNRNNINDIINLNTYNISPSTAKGPGSLTNSNIIKTIEVNIQDNMEQLIIKFKLDGAKYYPVIFNSNGTIVNLTGLLAPEYGMFEHTQSSGYNNTIKFNPNEDLAADDKFYIGFINSAGVADDSCFEIILNHNVRTLEGLIYADYSKPLNYQDITYTSTNYIVSINSVTKIIPVFKLSNPSEYYDISELNISKVTYSLTSGSGTIKPNGEYTAPSNAGTASINVSYVDSSGNTIVKTINFTIVQNYEVSYSAIGADIDALTYATSNSAYQMIINLYEHYGGMYKIFTITVGGANLPLTEVNFDKTFDIENTSYILTIPNDKIKGDIVVTIEFPVVYTISFDLQAQSFDPSYNGEIISFKVEAGTTFNDLFGTSAIPNDNLNKIIDAVNDAKKIGIVFGGFYLIDSGTTMQAYSMSFEELLNEKGSLGIYSSLMYYGRWSFLIEHIEAPGTEIKTSFEDGFMENINPEDRPEFELRDTVTIPINNNRGYVFTVEKEEGFIGEAQVNAYIVDQGQHIDVDNDGFCDKCGNNIATIGHVREVTVQKYHENMYLYFIPAEEITGYLVIVSNVTNSSIIVGKNTASVTEQILPEDGVYTFKYAVNHKYNESYIYDPNANLLGINKNILVKFMTQTYNGTDITEVSRILPAKTTVEVYYTLYVNGEITEQITGVYKADGTKNTITLDEFNKWNQHEKAFNTTQTFSQFLGSNDTVSEVYYFVVTPPNGFNTIRSEKGNEIINEIIHVGYFNEDAYDPANGNDAFLLGTRNDDQLNNRPLDNVVNNMAQKESSEQIKIYSVTPSRKTELTTNDSKTEFTFTDITSYHIIDLNTINLASTGEKIGLGSSSVIESSLIKGNIRELGLKLGYNTGIIKVSGKKTEAGEWTTIASFEVDKIDYTYYYIDFEEKGNDYKYFKIENLSDDEIRLEAFSYSTISNAMLYEFNVADAKVTGNVYSYVNEIVGDTRHDGKTFMLELEFANTTDISNDISINVNGNIVKPLLDDRDGKVRAFFNLSEILTNNAVETITFTIDSAGETLVKVKLLESSTAQKPAVSEERVVIEP